MALTPGTVIESKYRIVRLLGQGGMGAVYEGENTRISRRVAIKVLHTSLAAKETLVRRFEQEAKAAGLIGSEHIVEVLDIGSLPSGELFMVMEFLEGEDLGSRIKKLRRLKPHDAANIVHQLLEGLTAAHKAGIIHRDLKPENVFLLTSWAGRRDFVKVLDFGVSKFSTLSGESMSMTSTGAVVGTPYYLSPEQARGLKNIDARSDLYSVGVVLYQAVTGRLPFNAETFNELVFKIALEEPEPAEIVVPNLDRSFAAIISRAMVRDVNGRFQSAREFQEALEQWMAMNPSADGARARATAAAAAPVVAPAQGAPVGRSGTLAMEQVPAVPLSPPPYPGAPAMGPAAPYATPQAALGAMRPHAQPGAAAAGMQPPAFGAAAPAGFAQPGGYPGTPMTAPLPGATPHGAPMTTPQPGVREIPEGAAAPPNKRGLVVAAALVGVLAIAGGAFGAHLIFGRSETQGGASTTTPQTSATQTAPPAPPTAAPSQAPSAETANVEPTAAPSSTASAPPAASTATTTPAPPATNNAGTASTAPKGPFPPPGPSKTIPPTPTAPTPTTAPTAPPKPTGRVIGSDL
ncbi:MAG TPA: protein kinase [Polyangiaceae bacterium]|nr:protein kinase [Polyangiaceae bacterium]